MRIMLQYMVKTEKDVFQTVTLLIYWLYTFIDLVYSIYDGLYAAALFIDLSQAFDTVDHKV